MAVPAGEAEVKVRGANLLWQTIRHFNSTLEAKVHINQNRAATNMNWGNATSTALNLSCKNSNCGKKERLLVDKISGQCTYQVH